MYIITRDGMPINQTRYTGEFDLLAEFHRRTSQSMDWAIQWEGYAVVEVPDDRWSELEADSLRRNARYCLRDHGHSAWDKDPLTRENCGACVLLGYGATDHPLHASWSRIYVQAGRPILDKWLAAFQADRDATDEANTDFRHNLELDIATWGVRRQDGTWLIEPVGGLPTQERVLGSDAARAVGRFQPDGPSGYRAATSPNAPLRATRKEALADERAWLDQQDQH